MMSLNKFKRIWNKQGGLEIIKNYNATGVLMYSVFLFPFLCSSSTELKIFRNAIEERSHKIIKKKFFKTHNPIDYSPDKLKKKVSLDSNERPVWFMWLQGIENAPRLVKNNYDILIKNIGTNRVKVITQKNISEYFELPSFIVEKWRKGYITTTHLSDIIRLELLYRYGGIWIDSTVMMTCDKLPNYLEDDDFFVPQTLKPGKDGKAIYISSWLMSSNVKNIIVSETLGGLYYYWHENNKLVNYFLLHHFMEIAFENNHEKYFNILPIDNGQMHSILISVLESQLSVKQIRRQLYLTDFQKLSNKTTEFQKKELIYLQNIRKTDIERNSE
ncbi:glycosyl transferase [Companilactobacillus zhachilii]|uniref:capsular polysaccharide synthesis protein n=1 Tax=Companilactobacillus zhachilii TaxID=2304606 RepID=UPI0019225BC4|nr:capsular polysaccharide synthesis protein [Companilactobacillus zhachilii]MBL3532022.1 glycosyl transferase [Companilactobacillus zhachilii]